MSVREFLPRNMDDGKKLQQFVDLIWPFFKKMSLLNQQSLQFFNQEYHWSHRNCQEGTVSLMTLTEIVDNDRYLIKLNRPENFFKFTYRNNGT